MKTKKAKKKMECLYCQKSFGSYAALHKHRKTHAEKPSVDIELLMSGHMPAASKAGGTFKGKNKVIIS